MRELFNDLPQTQIARLGKESSFVLLGGQLFYLASEHGASRDFAQFSGRRYPLFNRETLAGLEEAYKNENSDAIAAWEIALISSVVAKIPKELDIAQDPKEIVNDPVLRYLVGILIPYMRDNYLPDGNLKPTGQSPGAQSVKARLEKLTGVKIGDYTNEKAEPAKEQEVLPERRLSPTEVIDILSNAVDKDIKELVGHIGVQNSFAAAIGNLTLFVSHGLCYRLYQMQDTQKHNHNMLFVNGNAYTMQMTSDTVNDLEAKVQESFMLRRAAVAFTTDRQLNSMLANAKKKKENIYNLVFKDTVSEAGGKSFDIPKTKFGVHIREDGSPPAPRYYIYINTPHCAVPAQDKKRIIQGIRYEIEPMRIGVSLTYDEGIKLGDIKVLVSHSKHQAFDLLNKYYDGVCIQQFRHYWLVGEKNEEAALNAFVRSHLEKGICEILTDKIREIIITGEGQGHEHVGAYFKSQEITEKDAQERELILRRKLQ